MRVYNNIKINICILISHIFYFRERIKFVYILEERKKIVDITVAKNSAFSTGMEKWPPSIKNRLQSFGPTLIIPLLITTESIIYNIGMYNRFIFTLTRCHLIRDTNKSSSLRICELTTVSSTFQAVCKPLYDLLN